MVSQLLDPRQPHNLSDGIVVAVNVFLMAVMYMLPNVARQPVFAIIFLFWRGCYNIGIGWLLHKQSNSRLLTSWAEKSHVFEDPNDTPTSRPWLHDLLKAELEKKIPNDYDFDDAPIEYNTWLLFRRVVDLVLMCDFTSYCLFAATCGGRPAGEAFAMTLTRWVIGISLIVFNLWVKLDAHRVVKDYAWYWGDFFYLTDKELIFDGVFKVFPHPMYSVGYVGYYGISLMAANYKVLLISIVAHLAQYIFLVVVESPHIEKTYPQHPEKYVEASINVWDLG
jgi:phosphatidylethanolamine N-methyltransferase